MAMLGAMAFLIVQSNGVSRSIELITNGYLPLTINVDALRRYQENIDTDLARLKSGERRPGRGISSAAAIYGDALQEEIAEARLRVEQQQRLNQGQENAVLNKALIHLNEIESLFSDYETAASTYRSAAEEGAPGSANSLLEPVNTATVRLGDEIDGLSRTLEGRIDFLTDDIEKRRVRANIFAVALAGLAALVSLFGIGAVSLALRPISALTKEVQRLGAGDYSGRVDVQGADELSVLAEEFNAMVRALQLRDKTLVERAEQLNVLSRYLGSVLDNLDDALFVVEDGRVSLTNPAAARVWSIEEGTAPPTPLQSHVRETGRREIEGPGKTLHEVRVTAFGESGFVVVSADITQQTRAKERLARSERLALIGQMLAQITHEVRNPLNALSLNSELLGDELGVLDPDKKTEAWELLATVSGEIQRLTDVTAHYLQLARRPPARLDPEDLALLLEDVMRLLSAELKQQGVAWKLNIGVVPRQLVDGNQLRQAIINVIRNAVEAGAHALELELSSRDHSVAMTLSDNGPGMTAEQIDKATDPFFSTKSQGTGLGLAITRQILEDHDGQIRVTSPIRGATGTRITLELPSRPTADSKATMDTVDPL
jgi:nitrogen fixation/metabolism regulation signal transduction histidine kinase